MDCTANQTWWVEVTHTGSTRKRPPQGHGPRTYVGLLRYGSRHIPRGLGCTQSLSEHRALLTDPVEEPHVHTSNVPEGLRPHVLALLEKHRALSSGHLGSIKATEHRIELKPGSKPVRLNPYRKKPDGSPLFCIDYRQSNERTVRDSYPLPRMDDCLESLA